MAIFEEVDDSASLRRLYHLLALAPVSLRSWFAPSLPENTFEQVLRQSRQAAAFSLIGEAFDLAVTTDLHDAGTAITLRLGAAGAEVETRDGSMERAMVRAICEIGLELSEP